jgi:copper chaperone CopZ
MDLQATLDIEGMHCAHCVATVRRTLEQVPSVKVQTVDIGSATVAYDPSATTLVAIADAVNEEGYEAVIQR